MNAAEHTLHRLMVTENSRYHMADDICIAVRDERTGCWHRTHQAVGAHVVGSLRVTKDGSVVARIGSPTPGERVIFSTDVVTSPLVAIETGSDVFESIPLAGAA